MSNRHSYPYDPRRKSGNLIKDRIGAVLIVIALLALITIFFWGEFIKEGYVEYDNTSYCPVSGSYAKTVLLIDLTDKITFIQEEKLRNFMRSLSDPKNPDAVEQHTMLSIYLLNKNHMDGIPTPLVEICNPGSGEGLSELTGNPRLANRRFTERFLTPVDTAVGQIVDTKSSDISPIIESIRGIAVSAFSEAPKDGYEHRLIVISDMLQNSDSASHYHRGQKWNPTDLSKLNADLEHVSRVEIKVISRKNFSYLQGKALVEYWREYFRASKSRLTTAKRWEE